MAFARPIVAKLSIFAGTAETTATVIATVLAVARGLANALPFNAPVQWTGTGPAIPTAAIAATLLVLAIHTSGAAFADEADGLVATQRARG